MGRVVCDVNDCKCLGVEFRECLGNEVKLLQTKMRSQDLFGLSLLKNAVSGLNIHQVRGTCSGNYFVGRF